MFIDFHDLKKIIGFNQETLTEGERSGTADLLSKVACYVK
jgi:hypothetical protein